MGSLGEEAEVSDDLWESILNKMLVRLQDRVPAVRAQAVHALARLQDPLTVSEVTPEIIPGVPGVDGDRVVTEYVRLLATDNSKDVRRAVLTDLAMTPATLPVVLSRTRDVHKDVRRHAFQVCGVRVQLRALSIAQRCALLTDGLNDREPTVKAAALEMLARSWLPALDGDPVSLITALDVESNTAIVETAIRALLARPKALDDLPRPVMSLEPSTPEQAIYLRLYCEHLKEEKMDQVLDEILPDVPIFCSLLREHVDKMETDEDDVMTSSQFVCREMLRLARVLDLSDLAGHRAMEALLGELILNDKTTDEHLEVCVSLLGQLHTRQTDFARTIVSILSDIRDPVDSAASDSHARRTEEVEELKEKLETLQTAKKEAQKKKDKGLAAAVKLEIAEATKELNELKSEMDGEDGEEEMRWARCLSIIAYMLANSKHTLANTDIASLLPGYVLPSAQNDAPFVRERAMHCLGIFCLLDETLARRLVPLFLQVLEHDVDTVRVTALRALFDLVTLFGLTAFDEPPSEDQPRLATSSAALMTQLIAFLSHEESEIRTVACEGFAKLLFNNVVSSPHILSRMVIQYFNPVTEDDTRLRQCLTVFLPAYAFSSPAHQAVVEEAVVPTLRVLARAPRSSPLATINIVPVGQLLLYLTESVNATKQAEEEEEGMPQGGTAHERLALVLIQSALALPQAPEGTVWPKLWSLLRIEGASPLMIKTMVELVHQVAGVIQDKTIKKTIARFQAKLASMDTDAPMDEALKIALHDSAEAFCKQIREENPLPKQEPKVKRTRKKAVVVDDEDGVEWKGGKAEGGAATRRSHRLGQT